MVSTLEWLLNSSPWVEYRTRLDLLGQPETDPDVIAARRAMLDHPLVQGLITELGGWPGNPGTGVSKASHPLNKLVFLADIGLTIDDPGISAITERVLAHQSPEGAFMVGSDNGRNWSWKSCDFPSLSYALVKMGLGGNPRVKTSVDCLARYSFPKGWPCVMSRDIEWYTEPGPYDDCCPIVNIIGLKTLTLLPELQESKAARDGADTLLDLWENHRTQRPNMFGIGKRFVLLKAPFVWYDILHMLEVLTQFPRVRNDKRLAEMLKTVRDKADEQNRFTIETLSPGWEKWDFGQGRQPSPWLTFLVHRIFQRAGNPLV